MANGKFSNPRPHRDEERQIEEAFRQLTGQQPLKKEPEDVYPLSPQDFALAEEEAFPKPFEDDFELPQPKPAGGAYARDPQPPKQEDFDIRFDDDFFGEEDAPEQRDFLDDALAFISENKKLVLAFLCSAALLMLVLTISIFFKGSTESQNETILNNIYLADISVSGLTKSEAIAVVKEATSQTYSKQPMIINLSGTELVLSPKDTGAKLDIKAAVDAAYAYGRTGSEEQREQIQQELYAQPHIIALLPYLELDKDYIEDTLRTYAEDAGSTLTQTSYGLEGTQPQLSTDKFNENAPTQTLVITIGTPGIGFDAKDVYDQVLDAYSLHQFRVKVEDVESVKDPEPVDLEAIYEEFYIEPVDARVYMQTFKPIAGSYGYGFDMEEAQKLLDKAQFGDQIRIPMEYIEPEILDADMFFRDALGESTVSHISSKERNTNLQLACDAINGKVLDPGEQFSFNDVVGNRTSGKGYKPAFEVIRENNQEGDEILGGGVSQVASALYHSVLLADLQVDYRVNQDFAPGYIKDGLDVDVQWRSPDFQFTNNTGYPIRIEATATKGAVTIQILGTDERDYYIKMESKTTATNEPGTRYKEFPFDNAEGWKDGDVIQEGIAGFTVKTYKYKYNKANGSLLSQDFVAASYYETVDYVVARVKPQETTEAPTEAPTEPSVPPTAPSVPPTEPSTAPTVPPTEPATTPTVPPTQPSDATEPAVFPPENEQSAQQELDSSEEETSA